MMASCGLLGGGAAAAASPRFRFKAGAEWTLQAPALGFCEIETFASNITFTADLYGDSGRFIKKANWVDLFWYQGANTGGFFNGTYKRTPVSEYKGTFSIGTETFRAKLVKGAEAGC